MTKKELEDKIGELEQQIAELKEELKKPDGKIPVGKIWKPKRDERYYYNYHGTEIEWHNNDCCKIDNQLIDSGNCYPTREKAEFEAQREKYTRLFRRYVEQHSEPLDWNNQYQSKYCIVYNHKGQNMEYLEWGVVSEFLLGGTYASNKEVLQDAIDFVGEDNVKKYILEIEESK